MRQERFSVNCVYISFTFIAGRCEREPLACSEPLAIENVDNHVGSAIVLFKAFVRKHYESTLGKSNIDLLDHI